MVQKFVGWFRNHLGMLGIMLALFACASTGMCTNDVAGVTQIVDDATTVWTAVSGLIITVVGFLILIRFVRKLR